MKAPTVNAIPLFWEKVQKTDSCWNWMGYVNPKTGYGRANGFGNGKHHLAHRFSYEIHKGQIPDGLELDHLCKNRACVNPDHLEAVTRRENQLRGNTFTAKHLSMTHCIHGHPFSGKNLLREGSKRRCRACIKVRRARYWRRDNPLKEIQLCL